MNKKLVSAAVVALLSATLLTGCEQAAAEPAFESTVVNADGTVTFYYQNKTAREVSVDVQFAGRHAMERDAETGVWSVTLGPAAPDMYPYCFVVDGVSIMDPACSQWFPNEGFKNSLLEIPGTDAPLVHSYQPNPHGTLHYETYWSATIGCYNHAVVYTPPTYDPAADKEYPVFYLISGTTDTEEVYAKVGRLNIILDNLLAEGAAKEMIVVMPYGNPAKLMREQPNFMMMGDLFGNDLNNDLMPYIEQHYRTRNDRDSRAIGGFSRGGNQALSNGLMHLDKFSYLCSYSSFTMTNLPKVYDDAADTNSKIHLFWLGIGTDDFLYKTSHDYLTFLDSKGIKNVKEFTEGKFGHTWMNAKYFLDKTLRLLFDEEASVQAMEQGGMPLPELSGDEEPFTPGVMARLFPRPIISPEFGNGDSVTFRLKAPDAHEVLLEGEWLDRPLSMERDSDGVWSVVVSGMQPDVYCYDFLMDGTQVTDPSNMYLATDRGFKRSMMEMPGAPYAENAAEGIDYSPMSYRVENAEKGGYVLSAECSSKQADAETLPVLYLEAGANDTFESWYKIAKANIIMDQLVADGQCKPHKLVCCEAGMAPKEGRVVRADDYASWRVRRKALVKALTEEEGN